MSNFSSLIKQAVVASTKGAGGGSGVSNEVFVEACIFMWNKTFPQGPVEDAAGFQAKMQGVKSLAEFIKGATTVRTAVAGVRNACESLNPGEDYPQEIADCLRHLGLDGKVPMKPTAASTATASFTYYNTRVEKDVTVSVTGKIIVSGACLADVVEALCNEFVLTQDKVKYTVDYNKTSHSLTGLTTVAAGPGAIFRLLACTNLCDLRDTFGVSASDQPIDKRIAKVGIGYKSAYYTEAMTEQVKLLYPDFTPEPEAMTLAFIMRTVARTPNFNPKTDMAIASYLSVEMATALSRVLLNYEGSFKWLQDHRKKKLTVDLVQNLLTQAASA